MTTHDALDTCNACDVLGVDPNSSAGYCSKCEREARSPNKALRADGYYWIICEGCGIEVRREHKDAVLSTGQNVHQALGNRGERNGQHCGPCAIAKLEEMIAR